MSSASFVIVDDTGACHQGKSGVTTQIGSDTLTAFRTGRSKSRLALLRNLLGGAASYVVNEAAIVYLRDLQSEPLARKSANAKLTLMA